MSNGFYMTSQEYLESEERQNIKYEYVNGEVFAMTGGTIPHNGIALNLASALKNHLRGSRCRVNMADVKVCVSEDGFLFARVDLLGGVASPKYWSASPEALVPM